MALQIAYDDPMNGPLATAYARVVEIHLTDRPAYQSVAVQVEVFKSKAAANAGRKVIGAMGFTFRDTAAVVVDGVETVPAANPYSRYMALLNTKNPKAAAYDLLKSDRVEFAAATDV